MIITAVTGIFGSLTLLNSLPPSNPSFSPLFPPLYSFFPSLQKNHPSMISKTHPDKISIFFPPSFGTHFIPSLLSLHLISSHLISSHLISSHLITSHPNLPTLRTSPPPGLQTPSLLLPIVIDKPCIKIALTNQKNFFFLLFLPTGSWGRRGVEGGVN